MTPLPGTFEWLGEFLPSLLAATACGLLLGYERERMGRPIGLKTCTLVCVGATTYMASGHLILQAMPGASDPTRVASQIVTGIGFLGAGAILRAPGGVTGLTSAATIWFLGAVGVLIGCRYRLAGLLLTLSVLGILLVTRRVEHFLFRRHGVRLTIRFQGDAAAVRRAVVETLVAHGVPPRRVDEGDGQDTLALELPYLGHDGPAVGLLAALWQAPGVVHADWAEL